MIREKYHSSVYPRLYTIEIIYKLDGNSFFFQYRRYIGSYAKFEVLFLYYASSLSLIINRIQELIYVTDFFNQNCVS